MWDAVKAVLRGKFIALNEYIRKEGWAEINNLFPFYKNKKEWVKTKVSRRKEMISIGNNEFETRKS